MVLYNSSETVKILITFFALWTLFATIVNINTFLCLSRLVLTVVVIAAKILNDLYYTNSYMASIGGISLQNINQLEEFFIDVLDWNLHITVEEFDFFSDCVKSHSEKIQSQAIEQN